MGDPPASLLMGTILSIAVRIDNVPAGPRPRRSVCVMAELKDLLKAKDAPEPKSKIAKT